MSATIPELGKKPISPDQPTGGDIRFDPDFEALTAEFEKLTSPTASGEVDWQQIKQLAAGILDTKSKDLLVAAYLGLALLKLEQLRGLATGTHILRDMLTLFWDDLYPPKKRMKGRINALNWWKEKIEAALPTLSPETWSKEERDALLADLEACNEFMATNLEDGPMLHVLQSKIAGLIEEGAESATDSTTAPASAPTDGEQLEEQPAAPAADTPPATASGRSKPESQPTATTGQQANGETSADPNQLLSNGLQQLGASAPLFLTRNHFDPRAYRLNRLAAWLAVDAMPLAEDGRTLLPPPDGQIITALQNLYRSGNWHDLLAAAESHVPQFLFWLDLNRYSAEALDQLGRPEIAALVGRDTLDYCQRLPGLEQLTFNDTTPFADPATREWLRTIAQAASAASSAPDSGTGELEKQVADELAAAEKLCKQKKIAAALAGLHYKMTAAGSARERLLWQMALCRLTPRAKNQNLARPYLEQTLTMIDQYRVEQWEPALACEALSIVLAGLRRGGAEDDEELRRGIERRIAFLNPARALEML